MKQLNFLFAILFSMAFFSFSVSAGTCPVGMGVCDETIPFQPFQYAKLFRYTETDPNFTEWLNNPISYYGFTTYGDSFTGFRQRTDSINYKGIGIGVNSIGTPPYVFIQSETDSGNALPITFWIDINKVATINETGIFEGNNRVLTNETLFRDANSTLARTGNCPAGEFVVNTTTGGVQCMSSSSTTYYTNSTSVTGGSYTDTNVLNRTFWYDGNALNFTEGNGANPLDIYINYTGVTSFSQWILREYYLGSSSHHIQFQIWDYPTLAWENYFEIVGQTGQTWIVIPVFDSTDHTSGGIVQTRLHHPENGVSSHRMYIDVTWLISGNNIGASTNLDGYAKYDFGNHPFNGTGPITTTDTGTFKSLNVTGNTTFGQLINLQVMTLPACVSLTNGSIGRNSTKLYFCDGSIWNGLY